MCCPQATSFRATVSELHGEKKGRRSAGYPVNRTGCADFGPMGIGDAWREKQIADPENAKSGLPPLGNDAQPRTSTGW